MELKYGLISADDHVYEHPEVWTARMSKQKWGDLVPHVETDWPMAASAGWLLASQSICRAQVEPMERRELALGKPSDGMKCRQRRTAQRNV